ncbi:hypothetical protein D3C83_249070 [compost metagenome]
MGVGCAWIVAGAMAIAIAGLVVGMVYQMPKLVLGIGTPTICLAIVLIGGLIAEAVKAARKRRERGAQ